MGSAWYGTVNVSLKGGIAVNNMIKDKVVYNV